MALEPWSLRVFPLIKPSRSPAGRGASSPPRPGSWQGLQVFGCPACGTPSGLGHSWLHRAGQWSSLLGAEDWSQLPLSPFLWAKGKIGPLAGRGAEGSLQSRATAVPKAERGHSRDSLCADVFCVRAFNHRILWALPTSSEAEPEGSCAQWLPGSVTGTARTQTCLQAWALPWTEGTRGDTVEDKTVAV